MAALLLATSALLLVAAPVETIIDVPDPVGDGQFCLKDQCYPVSTSTRALGPGHGIVFPGDNKSFVVRVNRQPKGMYEGMDDWERAFWHTKMSTARRPYWVNDFTPFDHPTQNECQDLSNDACAEAGWGSGSGNATVSDPDENNCVMCGDSCELGCDDAGDNCPAALFVMCE